MSRAPQTEVQKARSRAGVAAWWLARVRAGLAPPAPPARPDLEWCRDPSCPVCRPAAPGRERATLADLPAATVYPLEGGGPCAP